MKNVLKSAFDLSHGISKLMGALVVIFVVMPPHFLVGYVGQKGQTRLRLTDFTNFVSIRFDECRSRCQLDLMKFANQFFQQCGIELGR